MFCHEFIFDLPPGRDGQGEVYKSLVEYFEKDRMGEKQIDIDNKFIGKNLPKRKTVRTTKEPVANKGWKNRR